MKTKIKINDTVIVSPFSTNTTRRGYSWNCRVLKTLDNGWLLAEPIEEAGGAGSFTAERGEYKA